MKDKILELLNLSQSVPRNPIEVFKVMGLAGEIITELEETESLSMEAFSELNDRQRAELMCCAAIGALSMVTDLVPAGLERPTHCGRN